MPPPAERPRFLPPIAFDKRWETATFVFLVITTVLRVSILSSVQLVPDEAYYWEWSRHLSLGYYDQGPMIAYVIRLTTALFGTSEFGVRIGVLAASLGTMICAYVLAKRVFSPMTGFLTALLLGLTPLMELGSLIATYDPIMVFFWSLTALYVERALFSAYAEEQRSAWIKAGLSTGLGLLSKHTMLFIVPCLLLFLLLSPAHRVWLRRPQPYVAFLLTLALYSGVIWWNAQHHWWTFGHLLFLTHKNSGTPMHRFGDFLGSQALLIGPGLFVASLIAGLGSLFRRASRADTQSTIDSQAGIGANLREGSPMSSSPTHRHTPTPTMLAQRTLLACMGVPIFVLFCALSLKTKVQGNWAATAWLTPPMLVAEWMTGFAVQSRGGMRRAIITIGTICASGVIVVPILLIPSIRTGVGIHFRPWEDATNTALGWREIAARVQQSRKEFARGNRIPIFLAGNGYQHCAELAFYLPDHPETHDLFLHNRLTMYAANVDELRQHLGQDALFIDDSESNASDLGQLFDSVEWEPPLKVWRRPVYDEPIHIVHIARCRGMRRFVGLQWAEGG